MSRECSKCGKELEMGDSAYAIVGGVISTTCGQFDSSEEDYDETMICTDCIEAVKPKPVYNHAFTIAFEVLSTNDGENVTADELRAGLEKRLNGISDQELIEACGLPFDSFETEM